MNNNDKIYDLQKTFRFEAAHRLTMVDKNHPCSKIHGHSFAVNIKIRGKIDQQLGWVEDYLVIKDAMKPIIKQLDHTYLNEIEGLENPTSENIAFWIYQKIKNKLTDIHSITIMETCTSTCTLYAHSPSI